MNLRNRIAKLEESAAPEGFYISEHLKNGNVLVWPMGTDKQQEMSLIDFEAMYQASKHQFILSLSEGMYNEL